MNYKKKYLKYKKKYLQAKKGGSKKKRDALQAKYEEVLEGLQGQQRLILEQLNKQYENTRKENEICKKKYKNLLSTIKSIFVDKIYSIYSTLYKKALKWVMIERPDYEYTRKLYDYIDEICKNKGELESKSDSESETDSDSSSGERFYYNDKITECARIVHSNLNMLNSTPKNYLEYTYSKAKYIAKLYGEVFDEDNFRYYNSRKPLIPTINDIKTIIDLMLTILLEESNNDKKMSKDEISESGSQLLFHFNPDEE
jgi:hypothetical protein